MKPKFKVGDRVIITRWLPDKYCRAWGESLPISSIHTIVDISGDGGVRLNNGDAWWYHKDEIKLAENALQRLKKRYESKV